MTKNNPSILRCGKKFVLGPYKTATKNNVNNIVPTKCNAVKCKMKRGKRRKRFGRPERRPATAGMICCFFFTHVWEKPLFCSHIFPGLHVKDMKYFLSI